ncbi:MAG: hypothetical protein CO021_00305 [Deltaproteobacteria bacterium CG_4_9_14_0_2_um_filter_42_21]|nr:MAG: hypothetical protein CO021_00305 [Deltaproteobacteria bacterium CG_4_9_14_0_2_um_filter_42_21]
MQSGIVQNVVPFRNFTLTFSPQDSKPRETAVLVFHGFPAQPPWSEAAEKNRDLAEKLAREGGCDSYLMHYAGLGKSDGTFSFLASVRDSIELAQLLQPRYTKFHLVGHSWGGLVALNVYASLPPNLRGRVALLSPFTIFPDDVLLRQALEMIQSETKISYAAGDNFDDVLQDLRDVERSYNPFAVLQRHPTLGASTLILQAIDDNEVPAQSTQRFVNAFGRKPLYGEVDTDHKFSKGRDRFMQAVAAYIIRGENELDL